MNFFEMLIKTPEGAGALTGSLAGLLALVLAALFNAHLERRARAVQLCAERNSLTAALAAEVRAYKDLAMRRKNHLADETVDQQAVLSSTGIPSRRLFDANASLIGLLDSHITDDVAKFYFKLEDLEIYLRDTANFLNGVVNLDAMELKDIKNEVAEQWNKMSSEAASLIDALSSQA